MRRVTEGVKERIGEAVAHEPAGKPAALRVVLPLKTITPVLGGGVKPWQPVADDPVRISGIRGHLRWWWRALCPVTWSAEEMSREEAALWGGVGVTEDKALRSRIEIQLANIAPERLAIEPAGHHEVRPPKDERHGPTLNPRPNWGKLDPLAYALFPLQRSKEERDEWSTPELRAPMPTRDILRTLMRFTLDVKVRVYPTEAREEPAEAMRQLLKALWLWVHLGGIGARTRRGFGALALSRGPELTGDDAIAQYGRDLFASRRSEDLPAYVQELLGAGVYRSVKCIELGPPKHSFEAAHAWGIELLEEFRQGKDMARDPGRGRRPGQSRWPEPHTLRVERGARRYDHGHEPPLETRRAVAGHRQGTPRAALGLPLEIKFLKDRAHLHDKQADAQVCPDEVRVAGARIGRRSSPHDPIRRFASPLLIRPIELIGHAFPMIVALGGECVDTTRLCWCEAGVPESTGVVVCASGGARDDIARRLGVAGDALAAFCQWYRDKALQEKKPRGKKKSQGSFGGKHRRGGR